MSDDANEIALAKQLHDQWSEVIKYLNPDTKKRLDDIKSRNLAPLAHHALFTLQEVGRLSLTEAVDKLSEMVAEISKIAEICFCSGLELGFQKENANKDGVISESQFSLFASQVSSPIKEVMDGLVHEILLDKKLQKDFSAKNGITNENQYESTIAKSIGVLTNSAFKLGTEYFQKNKEVKNLRKSDAS